MKSKDIIPLLIVVVISTILAYVASSVFIDDTPASREIRKVNEIQAGFPDENELKEIFHDEIIDTFGELRPKDE